MLHPANPTGNFQFDAVLTGGACATLYSGGRYQSWDLDFILQSGATRDQLDTALKKHRKTGDTLGYTLLKLGYLSEQQLLTFLESKLGFPHANLGNYVVDSSIINLIPEDIARKYQIFHLMKVKNSLTGAMLDPLDTFADAERGWRRRWRLPRGRAAAEDRNPT